MGLPDVKDPIYRLDGTYKIVFCNATNLVAFQSWTFSAGPKVTMSSPPLQFLLIMRGFVELIILTAKLGPTHLDNLFLKSSHLYSGTLPSPSPVVKPLTKEKEDKPGYWTPLSSSQDV